MAESVVNDGLEALLLLRDELQARNTDIWGEIRSLGGELTERKAELLTEGVSLKGYFVDAP